MILSNDADLGIGLFKSSAVAGQEKVNRDTSFAAVA